MPTWYEARFTAKRNPFKEMLFQMSIYFRGTSGIDIDLDKVDIDQCPQPDDAKEPNVFAGSARCKPETTKVGEVSFSDEVLQYVIASLTVGF